MRVAAARAALLIALVGAAWAARAVPTSYRYRSPRNPERKVRASTELIVLHTTEAPARSSLNKVSDRGECHYCVTEDGGVYAIVDRDREAFHAGRSMWNGREDVDKFSVGIECVGHHDHAMPMAQIVAIRNLVKELQAMYRIPDERVVAHSHVAYGAPNRWHRCRHRGRKRCGMLFAMPSVRRALNLSKRPAYDPDTRARRLFVADEYLNRCLYGSVDLFRSTYPASGAPAPAPRSAPAAPRVPAKAAVAKKTPAKKSAAPASAPKSVQDLKARGYVQKGVVTKSQTALKIAGARWNAADTYYTIRDKVIPGNRLDAAHIEKGMGVWLRR